MSESKAKVQLFFDDEQIDHEKLRSVFVKESTKIKNVLADQVVAIYHVGSTAIIGMPGTPVVDILVGSKTFPPSMEIIEKMKTVGFEYSGKAPHDENDTWFMGGTGVSGKGSFGRCTCHWMSVDNEAVENLKAYVDYVNSHKAAFEEYKAIKIAQSKSQDLMKYKKGKSAVVIKIMADAISWRKAQQNS
eukprot:TRINITY_DN18178_c0_g1_i2.p1 TRINITY_DN18178_c0_g1~~TRINITY_DN18178_c0_g1_i2.p1  ORF type:complete len:189 (-),score=38.51 TRINITY_DN18178_c0_g1_i2:430-996(-)